MYDNDSKIIQNAIDDCLAGIQNRPSLKSRVFERVAGTRHSPRKLTFAMAMILLLTLITVAALAIGAFTGIFRIEQEKAGTFRGCISTGDCLYVMTSAGFHSWHPDDEELTVLLSSEELQQNGILFDSLLFLYDDTVGLLCRTNKTIWKYQNGQFSLLMDYAGSAFDIEGARFDSIVYQDGWLFAKALEDDVTEYDSKVYRLELSSGKTERLSVEGLLQFCNYKPGEILAITADRENKQDSLIVIDAASGEQKATLYTTRHQGLEGIAYDTQSQLIYALVKGSLAKWNGNSWEELQGYASHFLADSYAVVDDGFVSVSYNDMQYLPFIEKDTITTLSIRGYRTISNEDADFQELNPSIAVVRDQDPSLTATEVRKAIESGDSTDLFHVKLDFDLLEMFKSGLLAPLTSSEALVHDAEEMLPVFANYLAEDGQLFAVPSMAFITVWTSEEESPDSFGELLRQHSSQKLYIAHHWSQEPWTKADYAEYLLTTYIAEATKLFGSVNFDTMSFRDALEVLQSTTLPMFTDVDTQACISTSVTVSLSGVNGDNTDSQGSEITSEPKTMSRNWVLPSSIGVESPPDLPAKLYVYVLNPNAKNPDAAIRYLEYIAAHRLPGEEAILKPDTSGPALHPGVQKQIEWMIEDQRAYDREHGIKTDEAILQAWVEALSSDASSWDVAENILEEYKRNIVPYIDLRISPFLSSSEKSMEKYEEMVANIMEYVEERMSIEECISALNKLVETV